MENQLSSKEISLILKNEYLYKINIEKQKLLNVLNVINDTKWLKIVEGTKGTGKLFTAKIKNNKLHINENGLQFMMCLKHAKKVKSSIKNIIENPELIDIIQNYFNGSKPVISKTINIFYSKNNGSLKEPLNKQMWHVDDPVKQYNDPNYKFIKLFIPLYDVNDNNGVTHVVKGSRENLPKNIKLNKIQKKRFDDTFIKKNYKQSDIKTLHSQIGEIFLVRTDGFHKGGFCKNGERLMIVIEYTNCAN
jgi:hypothetical protein